MSGRGGRNSRKERPRNRSKRSLGGRLPPEILPPPTLPERHEINELMRVARSYTHPIIFNHEKPVFGAVVLLRHRERLFGITTARNIQKDLMIQFRLSPGSRRNQFNILRTHIHPKFEQNVKSSKFDLAVLEMEPNSSITAGDVGQLYTGGFGKLPEGKHKLVSNAFVWVVGYPSELAEQKGGSTVIYQTSFCTQILKHSPDEISLNYPETGYQIPHDGKSCEIGQMSPTSEGYIGGGAWVINYKPGELFIPHRNIKLVGIHTHWTPYPRLAHCIPSKVILETLKDINLIDRDFLTR